MSAPVPCHEPHTERIDALPIRTRLVAVASSSVTAAVFVGLFAAANAVLGTRTPPVQQRWLAWASTDLANLGGHPVGAMIVSAFLDDSDIAAWIALGLIGLISAGHTLGNRRAALLVTASHVVSTMISEGILAWRILAGSAPSSAVISPDYGPSYVVVAALLAAVVGGRWPARVASLIAFAALAPHLFGGLTQLEVGPVGHCCAMVIGALGGLLLRRRRS